MEASSSLPWADFPMKLQYEWRTFEVGQKSSVLIPSSILPGIAGLIWYVAWLWLVFEKPSAHPCITARELRYIEDSLGSAHGQAAQPTFNTTPWRKFFTSMPVYAIIVANFCRSWNFYLLVLYQARYMHESFGLSTVEVSMSRPNVKINEVFDPNDTWFDLQTSMVGWIPQNQWFFIMFLSSDWYGWIHTSSSDDLHRPSRRNARRLPPKVRKANHNPSAKTLQLRWIRYWGLLLPNRCLRNCSQEPNWCDNSSDIRCCRQWFRYIWIQRQSSRYCTEIRQYSNGNVQWNRNNCWSSCSRFRWSHDEQSCKSLPS